MEAVIEDKLPVPLDQLHSCRLSPACNLLTTQEAPRADLLIWSTKQQQKGKEGAEQQEHALLEESLDTPYEFLTTLPSSQRFGLAALPCKARRHGHTQTHKHTNTQTQTHKHTQKHKHTGTNTQTHRHKHTDTNTQTQAHTDT